MNRNSYRSIKYDKAFAFKLDFEGRNIPVIEKEYYKIETKNEINISVFLYKNRYINRIFISKKEF